MSDKTRAPRSTRSGSGAILSGLAVGAILGAPVAAAASAGAAELSPAVTEAASSISDQFRNSFTAGIVSLDVTDLTGIIVGVD